MMNLRDLQALPVGDLDALYSEERPIQVPRGSFRGTHLEWLPRTPGESPLLRPFIRLAFELTPFGVDFDQGRWFFVHDLAPRLGHFDPLVGPSRWLSTNTVQLHYLRSRLPLVVRSKLYDEVKPLSADLCLGLGGVLSSEGPQRHFFFALSRR